MCDLILAMALIALKQSIIALLAAFAAGVWIVIGSQWRWLVIFVASAVSFCLYSLVSICIYMMSGDSAYHLLTEELRVQENKRPERE